MGAIVNIFKNILGLITGLFGKKDGASAVAGKKGKDGFYLEAEPSNAPAAPAAPVAVAPVAATPAAGKAKAAAKGKKGKAAAAAAATAVAAVAAAPVPVAAQVSDPLALIMAAVAPKSAEAQAQEAEAQASFAEMNAVPMSTGGRRRPGANMTGYMDMAKTMRTR
jgi:hypothetical protein